MQKGCIKKLVRRLPDANIDVLWTVGPLSRFVAEEAIANGMPRENILSCETSEEMCSFVASQLRKTIQF
jgi:sorbitol-specific phosphotransferase system component IIBC